MNCSELTDRALSAFDQAYGSRPTNAAYAPGRIEVLGNHTDYNEGFVLSAAIDFGMCFLVAPREDDTCRITAGDLMETVGFPARRPVPLAPRAWGNYVVGVYAGLRAFGANGPGFDGLFLGNVPTGAGLSSSAALEMSTGLALTEYYGIAPPALELARIGQRAEHEFAGVKCGLLDQVSSLFGERGKLVMTDFRTMDVTTVPINPDATFLMCNTHAKHALVDGAYNERRQHCEEAAAHFGGILDHPVSALRDVTWEEWDAHRGTMDPLAARRSAHPIGENARVLAGRALLERGDLEAFGKLMYDSHDSSRCYFENSAPELDAVVDAAREIPQVLGARLSGGGFGGSVVAMVRARDAQTAVSALASGYRARTGRDCDIEVIHPAAGARRLDLPEPAGEPRCPSCEPAGGTVPGRLPAPHALRIAPTQRSKSR
jgi:galactokinase